MEVVDARSPGESERSRSGTRTDVPSSHRVGGPMSGAGGVVTVRLLLLLLAAALVGFACDAGTTDREPPATATTGATAITDATATTGATATPGATSTTGATATPGATSTDGATTAPPPFPSPTVTSARADEAGGGGRPGAIAPGEETTMRAGEEAAISGASAILTFTGVVTDSRCPVDVTCVWEGEALLAFLLDEGGVAQAISVPFGSDATAAVLGSFRVSVIELLPRPSSGSPITPDAYRATIVVEPLAPPVGASGVQGVVTLGPLCPVLRADQPCPDRPFEATLLLLDLGGREVARTDSASDGLYRIAAPGGSYTLVPQPAGGRPLPAASAVPITISADGWATVNVAYDSGIR